MYSDQTLRGSGGIDNPQLIDLEEKIMREEQLLTDLTDEQCEKLIGGHNIGPCNGDGRDYAEHHIVALATVGGLGDGGHKPGSHRGFSACLGVH